MNKVYVRDFKTRSVVKEIEVSFAPTSSQYDRFVMGLMRNMDLDKFFLDDTEYLADQEKKGAK